MQARDRYTGESDEHMFSIFHCFTMLCSSVSRVFARNVSVYTFFDVNKKPPKIFSLSCSLVLLIECLKLLLAFHYLFKMSNSLVITLSNNPNGIYYPNQVVSGETDDDVFYKNIVTTFYYFSKDQSS
jgi:hypothetical protein